MAPTRHAIAKSDEPIWATPILIAGPTASGKSALAIALARALGGSVINADSMQVYRDLRLLTARPTDDELAHAPHALYGHVPGATAYSTGLWLADVARALAACATSGRRPIVVGGTGLYFRALLQGLSPMPPVPDAIRAHWRGEAGRLGPHALHAILAERDPTMASRLRPTDPQRLVRALEVLEATGKSLGDWQAKAGKPLIDAAEAVRVVLHPERAWLRERCDRRFDQMMAAGALDEVRALADQKLDLLLPIMGALGMRPLRAHLAGKLSLTEAVAAAKSETRAYVKRQQTWARGQMADWIALTTTRLEVQVAAVLAMSEG